MQSYIHKNKMISKNAHAMTISHINVNPTRAMIAVLGQNRLYAAHSQYGIIARAMTIFHTNANRIKTTTAVTVPCPLYAILKKTAGLRSINLLEIWPVYANNCLTNK